MAQPLRVGAGNVLPKTTRELAQPAPGPAVLRTVDDVATHAVENKGSGGALDGGVRATMEAHLGADLGGVRVHNDERSAQSASVMGARAFAHGKDVYLAPGESGADIRLMAHELTHVVQQTGTAARAERKVEVGAANSPAEQQADAVADGVTGGQKPPMLVDEGAPVQAGQMTVEAFLAALRTKVEAAASDMLGPLWSVAGCPYIDKYFGYYQGRSARDTERALRLYVPDAATHGDAQVVMGGVVMRVRAGIASWRATGDLPADAAAIAPPEAATAAHHAAATPGAPGDEAQAMPDPDAPVASLGEGAPLASDVASRMSDALGTDVSTARVHTDGRAARLAADHDATAVTVGQNIAFGSGAYQPGTPAGDALLAHELAHTVQQKGADPKGPVAAESAAAESHADEVAAGAVAQMHGGAPKGVLSSLVSSFTSGLSLQRCPAKSAAPAGGPVRPIASAPPTSKPELHTQRFDGDKALDDVAGGKATIKAGEKSLQVTKIQQALVDLGLLGASKVTGTLDADTTVALKTFQHKATIPETGVVDAATMDALRKGFDAFKPQRDVALDPATAKDPMAGTRALNDDERTAISGVLNPQVEVETVIDPVTGAKTTKVKEPTFVTDPAKVAEFEKDLRKMIDNEITSQFDTMAKGKAADRADPKKMFDWSALESAGAEAKREVDIVFGGYKMGAEVKKGTVLNDRWEQQQQRIDDAKAAGDTATIESIADWRIQKIMNEEQGFKDVLKKYGAKSDRAPENGIIAKVKKDLMKTREADLLEIQKAWPGAAGGGKIFLQRYRGGDAMADRLVLWELFQTIIHEYIHTLTAKKYSDYADSLDAASGQTLREGVTDLLTKTVWSNVAITENLRKNIEGPTLYDPPNPVKPPPLDATRTYDETAQAEQLTSIVGERNLYAAYFLGKIELIGKK